MIIGDTLSFLFLANKVRWSSVLNAVLKDLKKLLLFSRIPFPFYTTVTGTAARSAFDLSGTALEVLFARTLAIRSLCFEATGSYLMMAIVIPH